MQFRVTKDNDLSIQFKSRDDADKFVNQVSKVDSKIGDKLADRITDKYAQKDKGVMLTTLLFPSEAGILISKMLDEKGNKKGWLSKMLGN